MKEKDRKKERNVEIKKESRKGRDKGGRRK
jgi:hypothetical protein